MHFYFGLCVRFWPQNGLLLGFAEVLAERTPFLASSVRFEGMRPRQNDKNRISEIIFGLNFTALRLYANQ